ncbi:DUF397 domain-containing protein [Streptomyces sp. G45]|uniref:DUF397 domain-containing protein n=1 Tax=Streptomyces sp. G45 TaxID=3406627 RepID=UPI003C149BF6
MGSSWTWRKSSASDTRANACVEMAWTGDVVLVRDSTRPRGAVLALQPSAWSAFLTLAAQASPSSDAGRLSRADATAAARP